MKAGQNLTPIRIASPYAYHFRKQWCHVFFSSCRILQAHEFTNSRYSSDQWEANLWLGSRCGPFSFPNSSRTRRRYRWRVLHAQWRVLHSTALK